MQQNIEQLIPHREPFLFVDEVELATKETIIGSKTFDNSNSWLKGSFTDLSFIPGTIIIESMAQCGGAGVKLLGITDGIFGLVSIDDAQMLEAVTLGQTIKFVIKNLRLSDKIIKQAGEAFVNDKKVLQASWMCVKLSS